MRNILAILLVGFILLGILSMSGCIGEDQENNQTINGNQISNGNSNDNSNNGSHDKSDGNSGQSNINV